ncbi:LLM class flavin-dependent oxidoreductase [Pseudonocardia spinosispora]|uniref:LLM class flavin-dependent oxidoreductase n=1 Tax=Pseudonocardia spinosispora TaxID=103441 RepID=UPI000402D80E|nr:LLM class flavin-dependent oxidoreductase [Pseudonocardia spinosispora]
MTHLAVELDGAGRHPAAWRLPDARPAELLRAGYWTDLARLAEAARVDFLAIGDSFVPPATGEEQLVRGRLDAVAIAARIAPLTSTIGLVPTATVTHTEPFHLSKAIATLDFVSLGRAGWQPAVSRSQREADLFGRKDAAPPETLWREAADAVEVVARLWDSWEDDAVIRDVTTGRYVDRDKLHYLDFSGEFFSVKGPSITPRSPQAHPPVVIRADEREALEVIGRWADVARVSAPDLAGAADARDRIRDAVAAAGRDPDSVAVLWDIEVLLAATADRAARVLAQLDDWDGGVSEPAGGTAQLIGTAAKLADLIGDATLGGAADGVTLVPLALPNGLRAVADDLVPLLVDRGLRPAQAPNGTLRERFGLPRPANHFTAAEVSA